MLCCRCRICAWPAHHWHKAVAFLNQAYSSSGAIHHLHSWSEVLDLICVAGAHCCWTMQCNLSLWVFSQAEIEWKPLVWSMWETLGSVSRILFANYYHLISGIFPHLLCLVRHISIWCGDAFLHSVHQCALLHVLEGLPAHCGPQRAARGRPIARRAMAGAAGSIFQLDP